MSDCIFPEVYAIVLPNRLVEAQDKFKAFDYSTLLSLAKLATKLPLEDVFHYVYAQTDETGFSDFVVTNKLTGLLQKPDNIQWLSEMKNQYESYVRQREDLRKLGKESVKIKRNILKAYKLYHTHFNLDERAIFFRPLGETEIPEERNTARMKLYSSFYDLFGYEILRIHPISHYLLGSL